MINYVLNKHYYKLVACFALNFLYGYSSQSQTLQFNTGFEPEEESLYSFSSPDSVVYVTELQRPQWVDGISGRALDLSANAVLRRPLMVDPSLDFTKDSLADLSAQVWVRTIKDAPLGTVIMGNRSVEDQKNNGWSIFSQENGAWGVRLRDGSREVLYEPTEKQVVNDGQWHHLAFSYNREKGEVWFYYDGKNVAIYQVGNLGSLDSDHHTVIGGSDAYWEYGSFGQWTAFNGYLDEVRISTGTWSADEIEKEYEKHFDLPEPEIIQGPLRVMTWNIWHGGRRYGQHVGVNRVIETIKSAQPDIIGLIETYGSGPVIADSLGYYFYLISSNLSIMSRVPITETIQAFRPFNFGGARLDAGQDREIVLLDTWLHYLPNYSSKVEEGVATPEELIVAEGETRHGEVQAILEEVAEMDFKPDVPVFMVGDFNSGSHLDWIESTKSIHFGYQVEWPVSKAMERAGFKDSYRKLHIDPLRDPGFTWTPRAATSTSLYGLRDRIDYIFYKGPVRPIESKVIDYHPVMFPSDHAAVISVFEWE